MGTSVRAGRCVRSYRDKAASPTVRCIIRSWGIPKGWPKGNSTPTTLGKRKRSAISGIIVTTTVGIPADSTIRANTGTFLQQSGQVGAKMRRFTASSFRRSASSGP